MTPLCIFCIACTLDGKATRNLSIRSSLSRMVLSVIMLKFETLSLEGLSAKEWSILSITEANNRG